ncbi:MAG: phosphoglycerate kinase [Nitrospinales bacterium]
MDNLVIGMRSLDSLSREDLQGKTIFIRVDFNVPMTSKTQGCYRVADDARIRRFLDLTFNRIHELTEGECRIIIGSHLGRPHIRKDHSGWDGVFNMQFVSSHFDTLMRKLHGDTYTIFPPETIDSQLNHSLEIVMNRQLPLGGIKFLPNLRYLLNPKYPDSYRREFIQKLGEVSDVYINCAFGCSHRLTKSIKLLPQIMRDQGKPVVASCLLREEVKQLGAFGQRALAHPEKTVAIAGGAKISDKIGVLKQFVVSRVKHIFLGGKMVNAFLLARTCSSKIDSLSLTDIPNAMRGKDDSANQKLMDEVKLAREILCLATENKVSVQFPSDFKVVAEYKQTSFDIKETPDLNNELQLDLGPRTIENFSNIILNENIENVFWNGPLGAYDHPLCAHYADSSKKLAKALFSAALGNEKFSVVIGGGDTSAILNMFKIGDFTQMICDQIQKQLSSSINRELLTIEFREEDCYRLHNYFISNFFVSTGGGASLKFLEGFLEDRGKSPLASYLPATATLMELSPA